MTEPMDMQANSAAPVRYAGFWRRFVAILIDGILLSAVQFVITWGSFDAGIFTPAFLISIIIYWLYFALLESSAKQATIGKMALGIVVTSEDGRRISFANATGRYFAKWISGALLMIGYIMAAFTAKKQALHDMLARTLVVKV